MSIRPDTLINIINAQQNKYLVQSFMIQSRNIIFKGIRKFFPDQHYQNGEQNVNQAQNSESLVFKLQEIHSPKDKDKYTRVHNILHKFLNDPRVIKNKKVIDIHAIFNTYLMIPTKYYPNRDVLEYMTNNPLGIENHELIRIASFQALHILVLLKNQEVVHNDFKFENLMVTEDPVINGPQLPFYILVFDFDDAQVVDKNGKSDIKGGTKIFNAPEMQRSLPHDFSVDIWSLGVNIYYYLTCILPFNIDVHDSNDTIYMKTQEELENIDDSIPQDAFDVIKEMLKFKPEDRITPEKALRMDWFNGLDPIVPMFVNDISTDSGEEDGPA